MSGIHGLLGWAAIATTVALAATSAWSLADGRRSGGRRDHRLAVDRLILAVLALVTANVLVGGALAAGGGARPADPLHLLYGVAALVALPAGWALGGRPGSDGRRTRIRRDLWVLVAAAILVGILVRLLATG